VGPRVTNTIVVNRVGPFHPNLRRCGEVSTGVCVGKNGVNVIVVVVFIRSVSISYAHRIFERRRGHERLFIRESNTVLMVSGCGGLWNDLPQRIRAISAKEKYGKDKAWKCHG
jgi:hypothetical protein